METPGRVRSGVFVLSPQISLFRAQLFAALYISSNPADRTIEPDCYYLYLCMLIIQLQAPVQLRVLQEQQFQQRELLLFCVNGVLSWLWFLSCP